MQENLFNFVLAIIGGTPLWVWLLLGYLIFIGIKATKTQTIYLPKLFILPTIFIALKYKLLLTPKDLSFFIYILTLIIGGSLGWFFGQRIKAKFFKTTKTIELPGNYATLILIIIFFTMKYIFGYWQAAIPALAAKYSLLEIMGSALLPGYFYGRALAFCYKLSKT
jgi:hypothetical protein